MKISSAILLLLLSLASWAQTSRQAIPIYVPGTAYKNTGWFIAPGITYMLPVNRNESLTGYVGSRENLDTAFTGDFSRKGKIGLYLEGGRHHFITDRILIDHIDYGLHFKMLRGSDDFIGLVNASNAFVPVQSNSKFSQSFAGLFFNASNIAQISNSFWIQNGLGVNADFRIINRLNAGPAFGAEWNYPSFPVAQVHYKFSFGWKPEPGIYIIPSIETPILNLYAWDDFKSTLPYFSGRYRPIIISLRVQWLSKSQSRKCENQPGRGPEIGDKSGKHKGNDLWGPQDKKIKRRREKAG